MHACLTVFSAQCTGVTCVMMGMDEPVPWVMTRWMGSQVSGGGACSVAMRVHCADAPELGSSISVRGGAASDARLF